VALGAPNHDERVAMRFVLIIGLLVFAAAVAILAAKNRDWLALAVSVVSTLTLAMLVLIMMLLRE
jgi:hypothetical protein